MASPGRKEGPSVARSFSFRLAAGRELGLAAAVAPAVPMARPVRFVTLTVQDAQRRDVTRTMRVTDTLQGLMDHYYDMVGSAGTRRAGRFVFDGKRLKGKQTPEELGMKNRDKIDFFVDLSATDDGGDVEEPAVYLTVKVVVLDMKGRTMERTLQSTHKLQVVMDAYYDSVPDVSRGVGKFLYDGGQLQGWQTLAQLKMDDKDEIEIDFLADMMGGGGPPGRWAATAAEQPPVPAYLDLRTAPSLMAANNFY
jgi:hypothetical protein